MTEFELLSKRAMFNEQLLHRVVEYLQYSNPLAREVLSSIMAECDRHIDNLIDEFNEKNKG